MRLHCGKSGWEHSISPQCLASEMKFQVFKSNRAGYNLPMAKNAKKTRSIKLISPLGKFSRRFLHFDKPIARTNAITRKINTV
jgi:hypothetical protein